MSEKMEARCARVQPCGCIVCTCVEQDQCSGCGAAPCKSADCVFDDPSRIVWDRHPLLDELAAAQAENERYGRALINACAEIATLINNANDNKREVMGLKRLTSADVLPNFIDAPALRADDAGRVERSARLIQTICGIETWGELSEASQNHWRWFARDVLVAADVKEVK